MKVLSVIIPTYNMEKYLRKCLDSLIISENMDYMEVLVINDGSSDKSSEIAHNYEKKYPLTFRVIDKENGHYGSCVNIGLAEAKGKYVKILDADDWFDTLALDDYLRFLMTTDVDMVLTDYNIVNQKGKIKRQMTFNLPKEKNLNVDDYCSGEEFTKLQMHAVTYKRDKLIDNEYNQTEGVPYTDQEWIFLPVTFVDTFCYIQVCLYQYLVGREGQSMDPNASGIFRNDSFNLFFKRVNIYNNFVSNSANNSKQAYLKRRLLKTAIRHYRNGIVLRKTSIELMEYFDTNLKKMNPLIYEDVLNCRDRCLFGLGYISYWRTHKKPSALIYLVGCIINIVK